MPFYDFACECGSKFNVMAKMKDLEEKSVKCPTCGSTDLRRVYGSINIIKAAGKSEPACPHKHVCGAHCGH